MSISQTDLDKLKSEIIKVIQDMFIEQTKVLGGHIQNLQDGVKKFKKRFSVIDDRLSDIEVDLLTLEKTEKTIKDKVDNWELEKNKDKLHSFTDEERLNQGSVDMFC